MCFMILRWFWLDNTYSTVTDANDYILCSLNDGWNCSMINVEDSWFMMMDDQWFQWFNDDDQWINDDDWHWWMMMIWHFLPERRVYYLLFQEISQIASKSGPGFTELMLPDDDPRVVAALEARRGLAKTNSGWNSMSGDCMTPVLSLSLSLSC